MTEKMMAKFAAYSQARDDGERTHDAGAAVGISDRTREKYERSYRRSRGLPPASRYPNMKA
jgi:hypothetical protein